MEVLLLVETSPVSSCIPVGSRCPLMAAAAAAAATAAAAPYNDDKVKRRTKI